MTPTLVIKMLIAVAENTSFQNIITLTWTIRLVSKQASKHSSRAMTSEKFKQVRGLFMHEVLRTSSAFTLVSGSKGMGFTASGTMGPRFNKVPWDWEIGC